MRKESLDRIGASVQLLLPKIALTTRLFYERLFSVAPEARSLFKIDMDLQRQHFAAAMAVLFRNLPMLDVLTEPLKELGGWHAAIGVRPEHYPIVCDAMLFAMGSTLKAAWTAELAADWREVIEKVSIIMMSGGTEGARHREARPA